MNVDTIIEDPRWQSLGLEALAQTACAATLAHLGHHDAYEISLLGCDDRRISTLNADFRGKPQATNVLSWPSAERGAQTGTHPAAPEPGELGDIAIAYETCAREAEAAGKDMSGHVTHLLVHGCLHLLGYDHTDDKDAEIMEGLETGILGKLGQADPYGA